MTPSIGQVDVDVRLNLDKMRADAVQARAAAGKLNDGLSRGAQQAAQKIGLANHEVTNLGFQLNDIAQGLATGNQSPFTILIQQGAQISQILGNRPGGVGGALSALAQGFRSFLNPVTLAITGLAVAALGAQQLYQSISNDVSATEALEQQDELIKRLAERYDEVDQAIARIQGRLPSKLDVEIDVDETKESLKALEAAFNRTKKSIETALRPQAEFAQRLARDYPELASKLAPLEQGLFKLANSTRDADVSAEELVGEMIRLADSFSGTQFETVLRKLIKDAKDSEKGILTLAKAIDVAKASLEGLGAVSANIANVDEAANARVAGAFAIFEEQDALDQLRGKLKRGRKTGGRGAKVDPFKQEIESVQDMIKALEVEAATFNMTESAAARFRVEQQLLTAAQETGGVVTAAERKEIEKLAQQYQEANDAAISLTRTKEALDFAKGAANSFFSDLRSGLRQGKSVWESFGNAALNVLDKIIDKLQGELIDAIFSGLSGGRSGVGGILGTLVTGIFGGAAPSPFTAGFYQNGGFTGNGPANAVAGVVHGGEYVFSKKATERIGVGNLEAMHQSARGFLNGGFVGPSVAANNNQQTSNDNAPIINIFNESGAEATATSRRDSNGRSVVDIVVGEVRDDMASGGFDKVLGGRFGARPTRTKR